MTFFITAYQTKTVEAKSAYKTVQSINDNRLQHVGEEEREGEDGGREGEECKCTYGY